MRLLLTGATGYAGRGLAGVLGGKHWVRGLDVAERPSPVNELMVGDIADLEVCRKATEGVDAMVLCHMAPNPTAYQEPPLAFDVNVKGTANLYHAAAERGIRRVVMVSTVGVLPQSGSSGICQPGAGPYTFTYGGLYSLTKLMGEIVARYHFENNGIASALLRPAWIVYDEDLTTKYGKKVEFYVPHLIDPRDIGEAALLALELPDLALEAFNIGQDGFPWDTSAARQRLGWQPKYRFASLPPKPKGMP